MRVQAGTGRFYLDHPADNELKADLRRGRAQSPGVLFDRYGRLVFQIAKQILHDAAEAEDLTRDIFLEIYRKSDRFDAVRGTVKTWLLQYAYHRSLNRRKYLAFRHFYDDYPDSAGREGLSAKESPTKVANTLAGEQFENWRGDGKPLQPEGRIDGTDSGGC